MFTGLDTFHNHGKQTTYSITTISLDVVGKVAEIGN